MEKLISSLLLQFDCLHNDKIRITLIALIFFVSGCGDRMNKDILVTPKHFKVQTSFIYDGRGITINTYWGSDKKHHVLFLDNYSPSWIKRSIAQYDSSLQKAKDIGFKTFTADGKAIQGDVGVCDSLSFENVVFKNLPFYIMPDNAKDKTNDDGVLGIDAMSKGIWKIDLQRSELTFASDFDSFNEISQSEILPANFTDQSITINVDFGHGNVKAMGVDLGYNGDMVMPFEDFNDIRASHKTLAGQTVMKLSTPAGENIISNISLFDTVRIGNNWFVTQVSSATSFKERLLGLSFFKRFDYVIFDFINKQIYIPKKVW